MRLPLATSLKTRTGAPEGKDARLKNCYVETRGDQSMVRKRPIAQGGIQTASIGTISQGGIGINVNGTEEVFYFYGDTQYTATSATGTTWSSVTNYIIGDHVTVDFVDFWALTNNLNQNPTSNPDDWSNNFVPPVPVVLTYATLSNTYKDTDVVLSSGNLSFYVTSAPLSFAAGTVCSNISKTTGKWYFEVTAEADFVESVGVVSGALADMSVFIGADQYGYGYSTDGNKYNNNSASVYATSYNASADVIGCAFDAGAGTVQFFKNGVALGQAFTGISAPIYAAVSMVSLNASTAKGIVNFGASAFNYSAPSGYNSGLYT